MKRRAAILSDLEAWSTGQAAEGFVLPIMLETAQDMADIRTVISEGAGPLRDNIDSVTSLEITEDQMDVGTADVLALCILLQGSGFLREYGKDGGNCPKDQFKLLVNSYRLIKAIKDLLVTQPELPHRLTLVRTLAELRSRLKPIINQRIKRSRRRANDRVKLGANGEDLMLGASTDSLEVSIDFSVDESLDLDLSMAAEEGFSDDLLTGGELPVPAKRTARASTPKTTTIEPMYETPGVAGRATGFEASLSIYDLEASVRKRRRVVATIVASVAIVVVLGIQVPRWFLGKPPAMTVYSEHIPATGLIRTTGDNPTVVFMVDKTWDDIPAGDRQTRLKALYKEVHDREDVRQIVVRAADGQDRARIDEGAITILVP